MSSALPSWISNLATPSIAADMAAADVNGVVSAAGLTKLLTDLAATLSSSTLTSAEFQDLQTIAANLENGLSTSAYLTYVFDALVDGNAANTYWTGGAANAVALGNLAASATQTQLDELIGKWFLGSDLPNSEVDMSGYAPFRVTYSTVTEAVFGPSGPNINDVNQGYLGDCYFLGSCAEVADMNSSYVESMFTDNGNGTYGVRFYYDGVAEYVTVNLSLPDGGTIFNQATYIWASLAEKAWAQFQAINLDTGNDDDDLGNSWNSIGNGGDPVYALEALTDASAITIFEGKRGSWDEWVVNSSIDVTSSETRVSTQSVLEGVIAALAAHDDVVVGSNTNAYDSSGKETLVADHLFSVDGYDSNTNMLELRNPWGTEAGQTWDTTFEVSLATLLADGDLVVFDNAGLSSGLPNPATAAQYLNNISAYDQFVGQIQILDTAAAISGALDALAADAQITSITISDNGAVGVDLAQLTSDATAIGELKNADGAPYRLAITDTATAVSADAAALNALIVSGHVASLTRTDVSGQNYTTQETLYDASGNAIAQIYSGVISEPYSSFEYDYVGGVFCGSKFTYTTVPSGASYSSYEVDYGYNNAFTGEKFFFANVMGEPYTGEEIDFDANMNLSRVLLTGLQDQACSSLELDYSGGTYEGYKAFYDITGQSFTNEEVDVSASGQLEKVVYSGMTGTPYQTVEQDFSGGALDDVIYGYTDVTGQTYSAYRVMEDANGNGLTETFDLNNGNHAEIALTGGQTLTSLGNDKMTGDGATTFVVNPIYGADVITNLTSADTVSMSSSEFANFAALQGAAVQSGANVVITAADGDTLTLKNMTAATLAGMSSNFTFHA